MPMSIRRLEEHAIQLSGFGHVVGDAKGEIAVDGIRQFPAFRGAALVQETHPDIPHIGGDHIAEDNQLNEGRQNQQWSIFSVSEKLNEFFSNQLTHPKPFHVTAPPF